MFEPTGFIVPFIVLIALLVVVGLRTDSRSMRREPLRA
jgi:hypothetical protein